MAKLTTFIFFAALVATPGLAFDRDIETREVSVLGHEINLNGKKIKSDLGKVWKDVGPFAPYIPLLFFRQELEVSARKYAAMDELYERDYEEDFYGREFFGWTVDEFD